MHVSQTFQADHFDFGERGAVLRDRPCAQGTPVERQVRIMTEIKRASGNECSRSSSLDTSLDPRFQGRRASHDKTGECRRLTLSIRPPTPFTPNHLMGHKVERGASSRHFSTEKSPHARALRQSLQAPDVSWRCVSPTEPVQSAPLLLALANQNSRIAPIWSESPRSLALTLPLSPFPSGVLYTVNGRSRT